MVNVVKNLLIKVHKSGTDPQMALLCLRATPIDAHLPSPAELLFGRGICTNLPAKIEVSGHDMDIRKRFLHKQQQSKESYDSGAGPEHTELLPGMRVMVQKDNRKGWLPVIHGKCDEPRSYLVQTPNGYVVRRNRRFLSEISPNAARKFNFR